MEFSPTLLGRLSFVLGRLYFRALEIEGAGLAALGIDVKQQAALTLLADEGPMTQQQLGQRLGIDRTTIVALVDGLADRAYVERRRSPTDRRAYQLTLTDAGHSAQRRGVLIVADAERELLSVLDATERRTVTDLLARAARARP